jgi:hypothetical protein
MTDKERIVYLRSALKNLVQSADRYIDDGSWIEHLTLDVEFAKGVLKSTRLNKESKNDK